MPIIRSAIKALRKDKRRTKINKPLRTKYKTAVKKASDNPSKTNLQQANKYLDRAVKKGIIKKNKANRLKSRLAKKAPKKTVKKTLKKKK